MIFLSGELRKRGHSQRKIHLEIQGPSSPIYTSQKQIIHLELGTLSNNKDCQAGEKLIVRPVVDGRKILITGTKYSHKLPSLYI